jgi:hypothetical protein
MPSVGFCSLVATIVTTAPLAVVLAVAQAQGTNPLSPRQFSELRASVPTVSSPSAQELRILWIPYPGAADSPVVPGSRPVAADFRILVRRPVPGTLPRERDPQLASDQLVVVAVDTGDREIDWQIIRDPRVLRTEGPGPDGRLTGAVLHRAEVEFLITLPGAVTISEIRLYEPVWTGVDFILQPIASIALTNPAARR